jgi:hypothetical protein
LHPKAQRDAAREHLVARNVAANAERPRQRHQPVDTSTSIRPPSTCSAAGGSDAKPSIPTSTPMTPMPMCSAGLRGHPHPQLLSDAFKKLVRRSGLPSIRYTTFATPTHASSASRRSYQSRQRTARALVAGLHHATYQDMIPGMQEHAATTFPALLDRAWRSTGFYPVETPIEGDLNSTRPPGWKGLRALVCGLSGGGGGPSRALAATVSLALAG